MNPEYILNWLCTYACQKEIDRVILELGKNKSWEEILEKSLPSSVEWLADHYYLPTMVLEKLAKNKIISIRENVAANPDASPKVLTELARDKIADVRLNVAWNYNTPSKALTKLTKDKFECVRKIAKERLTLRYGGCPDMK